MEHFVNNSLARAVNSVTVREVFKLLKQFYIHEKRLDNKFYLESL